MTELTELELRQEVLKLRRRMRKLTVLLRLALALLQASRFRLTLARLTDVQVPNDALLRMGRGAGGKPNLKTDFRSRGSTYWVFVGIRQKRSPG